MHKDTVSKLRNMRDLKTVASLIYFIEKIICAFSHFSLRNGVYDFSIFDYVDA